ncbi:hypothetical protein [Thermus antranikianii]|uniref:Uncharacterized protein n=1 Tax=Thermus antranikianii TaxID=88190 RepID=A0ABY7RRI0_9DEIN|nr:hypothetical protein [Thermus antranikianii]WCM40294.1 hypothetical protein GO600_09445 [Thermus antranikianii]
MLVVVARGSIPNIEILSAEVLRNVYVTSGGSRSYTLEPPLGTSNVAITGVPEGFSAEFISPADGPSVFYVGKNIGNGAFGIVGSGRGSGNFVYRQVRGFTQGDQYLLFSVYKNTSGNSRIFYFKGFIGGNISVTLPSPWGSGALSLDGLAHPQVSGLNQVGSALRGFALDLMGQAFWIRAFVTKGWLGGATTYKVPNLASTLTYTPFAMGEDVEAYAWAFFAPNTLDFNAVLTGLFPRFYKLSGLLSPTLDVAFVVAEGRYTVGGGTIQFP